jgi:hypothetical protein
VTDELLYTRRITDATYGEALAVLGDRRLLSTVTIAAYYEYVSMLLNVDRYPLPADAPAPAAAAAHALAPLTPAELRREPEGRMTARPAIRNEDTGRALDSLGASVRREIEDPAVRDLVVGAVREHWLRRLGADPARGIDARAETARMFAMELLETRFVSDATFARTREAFGERGLVNLIVLMGHANILCAQQALAGADCTLR